jgi:uncharacterized protein (TIGR00299 family) protein
MKTVYLDCASGLSGDMMLGALVDVGVDLHAIQTGLDSLGLPDCRLEREEVRRHAFRATKIHVRHTPEDAHRHLHHITRMIEGSQLTAAQKQLACRIFTRLGEAEAKVHGTTIQKVHFHEVGAVDSIADLVGVAIGLDLLGAEQIVCSPLPTGSGSIEIAHGRCSVPAPATAELLCGVPLAESPVAAELTTPTGAAIAVTVAQSFGPLPPMTIERIGYGAGDRDFAEQANLVRLFVGHTADPSSTHADQVVVLETNLDKVSAEVVGYCSELLMAEGALDVYATPIQMKKNRPGTKLTVLCPEPLVGTLETILFRETATLGVRRWVAHRHILERQTQQIKTPWGPVTGKLVVLPDGRQYVAAEYEDCRRLAQEHKIALQTVLAAAGRAAAN